MPETPCDQQIRRGYPPAVSAPGRCGVNPRPSAPEPESSPTRTLRRCQRSCREQLLADGNKDQHEKYSVLTGASGDQDSAYPQQRDGRPTGEDLLSPPSTISSFSCALLLPLPGLSGLRIGLPEITHSHLAASGPGEDTRGGGQHLNINTALAAGPSPTTAQRPASTSSPNPLYPDPGPDYALILRMCGSPHQRPHSIPGYLQCNNKFRADITAHCVGYSCFYER